MEAVGWFGAQGRSAGEGVFTELAGDGVGGFVHGLVLVVRLGIEEPGVGGGLRES